MYENQNDSYQQGSNGSQPNNQPYNNQPNYEAPNNQPYNNQAGYGAPNQHYNQTGYGVPENQSYYNRVGYGAPYNQSDYSYPDEEKKKGEGFGIASMVLGILSILMFCTGCNILLIILSVIFGIIQLVKHKSKGMAIAGLITSGISFLLFLVFYIVYACSVGNSGIPDYYDSYYSNDYNYDYDVLETLNYDGLY